MVMIVVNIFFVVKFLKVQLDKNEINMNSKKIVSSFVSVDSAITQLASPPINAETKSFGLLVSNLYKFFISIKNVKYIIALTNISSSM